MNQKSQKQFQMFIRVRQFGLANAADFAPDLLGTRLFDDLSRIIDEVSKSAVEQVKGNRRAHSTTKATTRRALREDLEAIARSARSLAYEFPELKDRFRLTPDLTDAEMLTLARAFAEYAEPLRQKFIEHELPSGFIEDLLADIQAFRQATDNFINATNKGVSATRSIQTTTEQGMTIVKRLDAVIRNRYKKNQPKLDEWNRARTVESSPTSPASAKKAQIPV